MGHKKMFPQVGEQIKRNIKGIKNESKIRRRN